MISVIIPTYNRANLLSLALQSLIEQDYDQEFEVMVADDGSHDHTEKVIGRFEGKLNLKYLKNKHRGVCHARNSAIRKAQGEILLFFDDDAKASRNWLKNTAQVMQKYDVVVGRGRPIANDMWQYFAPHYDRGNQAKEIKTIWECNLAVKKKIFDEVGLFSEEIGWGHEGNEFARRLRGKHKIMYEPSMLIYHDYASGIINYFRKQFMFGQKLAFLGDDIDQVEKAEKNNALEKLSMFKKLFIKIIARLGYYSHQLGLLVGKVRYKKNPTN